MKVAKLYNQPYVTWGVTKLGDIYLDNGVSQIIVTPKELDKMFDASYEVVEDCHGETLHGLVDWLNILSCGEFFESPTIKFKDDDGAWNYLVEKDGRICTTTDPDDEDMFEPIAVTLDYMHKKYEEYSIQLGEYLEGEL